MRIIAGSARGKRLKTMQENSTRPTMERVKEGIFSALNNVLPGANVLDLFAGSGQLGLEALSRGAAKCVFVENCPKAAKIVESNIQSTGFLQNSQLVKKGAQAFLLATDEKFDIVLMDPPFEMQIDEGFLAGLVAVCTSGAKLLWEGPKTATAAGQLQCFFLEKQYKYGTVVVNKYCKR